MRSTEDSYRVLVAEDSPFERSLLIKKLQSWGYAVDDASDGQEALECFRRNVPQVVITDLSMPRISGMELIRKIRKESLRHVYIIVLSGSTEKEKVVQALENGADDYLSKPFHPEELRTRILAGSRLLRLQSQDLLLTGMAKLADCRSRETGSHLERVREGTLLLGQSLVALMGHPFPREWVELVASMSVLHDIGKVGIPDNILEKPGKLTSEEYRIMRSHTVIGGQMLEEMFRKTQLPQVAIARDIVLYHHERFDGTGYPCRLQGAAIPLAARIVALADVYDALRSKRVYKKSFDHQKTCCCIEAERGKHFDPFVVEAFLKCHQDFDAMFTAYPDDSEEIR